MAYHHEIIFSKMQYREEWFNIMTPEAFAKLKIEGKGGMRDKLRSLDLRLGGKKAELIKRYQEWYDKQGGIMPSPPEEPEPTASTQAEPMLPKILKSPKTVISNATRKCVHDLEYTPGSQFRVKTPEKDISDWLFPVQAFVRLFLETLPGVRLTTSPGGNETTLRKMIIEKMPEIEAPVELTPFFNSWDIRVVSRHNASLTTQDAEFESQDLTGEGQAEEIEIINSALQHRLARWTVSFPRPGLADQLWPTTYTDEERKSIREYVLSYIEEHELVGPEMPEGAEEAAIEELQNAADFPVPMGRTKPVIKAV